MNATLYDRQIRLWGIETQKRIAESCILLIGYHSALLEELAKDLVLAGVGTLVIGEYDDKDNDTAQVKKNVIHYLGNSFEELTESLRQLNPAANICKVSQFFQQSIKQDCERLTVIDQSLCLVRAKKFDCCCLLFENIGKRIAVHVDHVCRENKTLFFYAESMGALGFLVVDLGTDYEYLPPTKNTDASKTRNRRKRFKAGEMINLEENEAVSESLEEGLNTIDNTVLSLTYPSLNEVFSNIANLKSSSSQYLLLLLFARECQHKLSEMDTDKGEEKPMETFLSFLQACNITTSKMSLERFRPFLPSMHVELITVSSCLAGVIGREVIKAVTRNEQPMFNAFVFDAFSCEGIVINTVTEGHSVGKRERDEKDNDIFVYDI
eukprot:jgi/Galph1/5469/GphlegSOOS_G4153.1